MSVIYNICYFYGDILLDAKVSYTKYGAIVDFGNVTLTDFHDYIATVIRDNFYPAGSVISHFVSDDYDYDISIFNMSSEEFFESSHIDYLNTSRLIRNKHRIKSFSNITSLIDIKIIYETIEKVDWNLKTFAYRLYSCDFLLYYNFNKHYSFLRDIFLLDIFKRNNKLFKEIFIVSLKNYYNIECIIEDIWKLYDMID